MYVEGTLQLKGENNTWQRERIENLEEKNKKPSHKASLKLAHIVNIKDLLASLLLLPPFPPPRFLLAPGYFRRKADTFPLPSRGGHWHILWLLLFEFRNEQNIKILICSELLDKNPV